MSSTNSSSDVVIAGAGMVGAAVACLLAKEGVRVSLIDRRLPEEFKAGQLPDLRVSALTPASLAVLEETQALSHLKNMRYYPFHKMAIWEEGALPGFLHNLLPRKDTGIQRRSNCTLLNSEEIGKPCLGYIVENRIVQLALHQVLKTYDNVEWICPGEIEGYKNLADGEMVVRCRSRKPAEHHVTAEINTQLIIGADGAESQIRRLSGLQQYTSTYEQQVFIATVEVDRLEAGITWQAFHPAGPRALLPLASVGGCHFASLVWYDTPNKIHELRLLDNKALLKAFRQAFPVDLPELISICDRGWFALTKRRALSYFCQGVVLAGDAAHTINPLAGQGVNLGFQDAMALSEVLTDAYRKNEVLSSEKVLKRYQDLRLHHNLLMQQAMDGFYHLFSNENKLFKTLRNTGLFLADRCPLGKKYLMRHGMGIL